MITAEAPDSVAHRSSLQRLERGLPVSDRLGRFWIVAADDMRNWQYLIVCYDCSDDGERIEVSLDRDYLWRTNARRRISDLILEAMLRVQFDRRVLPCEAGWSASQWYLWS